MYYVRMTDKFMSGWGQAKGMTNVLVIACDTGEQADAIEKAANDRPEMIRVQFCLNKPKARPGVLMTHTHFNELSGNWLKYYHGERVPA